jgi:hypothetical protein
LTLEHRSLLDLGAPPGAIGFALAGEAEALASAVEGRVLGVVSAAAAAPHDRVGGAMLLGGPLAPVLVNARRPGIAGGERHGGGESESGDV